MRHTLLVPLRLLLASFLIGILLSVMVCLSESFPFVLSGGWPPAAFILSRLISNLDLVLVASILAAVLIVLIGLSRQPGLLPLSLFLVLACAFGGMHGGLLGARWLRGAVAEIEADLPAPNAAGVIRRIPQGAFWTPARPDGAAASVLYRPDGDPQLAIRSAPAAERMPGSGQPEFSRYFLASLRRLADWATPGRWLDTPALVLNGSLALFLVGLWTIIKLTRWPLFNALLAIALLWAALHGLGLYGSAMVRDFARLFIAPELLPFAQALPLAAAGLLLLVVNMFRPSIKAWKREMGYE